MILWLAACTFTVDFDNAEPPGTDTSPSATTGTDTGTTPPLGPAVVQSTQCSGWKPTVGPAGYVTFDPTDQIVGPTTYDGVVPTTLFVWATFADVSVVVDEKRPSTVEPPTHEGSFVAVDVYDGQMTVFSLCAVKPCPDHTIQVVLPAAAETVFVYNGEGSIQILEAATRDVLAGTIEGDVEITGPARGVHAEVRQGSITVETPLAQVLDLHTSTGDITATAPATTELCAISSRGDLDLALAPEGRVAVEATNGSIAADLATRPELLSVEVVVGGADIALPAGAYDIDIDVVAPSRVTLRGVTHDPMAGSRVEGVTLGTGVVLRAR